MHESEGFSRRIIVGEGSPLQLMTSVEYAEYALDAGVRITESVLEAFRGFIYLVRGCLQVNGETITDREGLFLDDPATLDIVADANSYFMFFFGLPHNEPITQRGPYVL